MEVLDEIDHFHGNVMVYESETWRGKEGYHDVFKNLQDIESRGWDPESPAARSRDCGETAGRIFRDLRPFFE